MEQIIGTSCHYARGDFSLLMPSIQIPRTETFKVPMWRCSNVSPSTKFNDSFVEQIVVALPLHSRRQIVVESVTSNAGLRKFCLGTEFNSGFSICPVFIFL